MFCHFIKNVRDDILKTLINFSLSHNISDVNVSYFVRCFIGEYPPREHRLKNLMVEFFALNLFMMCVCGVCVCECVLVGVLMCGCLGA